MIGLEGNGYRVLGFTIDGPPPLGRIHLDMRPGLSVIYGLNGAGKTRLLAAITATLQGYAWGGGRGVIHVQINDATSAPREGFTGALLSALRVGALLETPAFDLQVQQIDLAEPADNFVRMVEQHLSTSAPSWELMELVTFEAARSGLFSLSAQGTAHPMWNVWISDCIRPDSPLAEAYRFVGPLVRAEQAILHRIQNQSSFQRSDLDELIEVMTAAKKSSPWELGHPGVLDHARDFLFDRPGWVPIELAEAGRMTVGPTEVIRVDEHEADLHAATAQHLVPKEGSLFGEENYSALPADAAARLATLEESTTQFFRSLIGAGPALRFLLRTPEEWFLGHHAAWVCDDVYGSTVPIDQLSAARRRWAMAAIWLALRGDGAEDVPSVILSDEPEAGMHRTAESTVASGLAGLITGAACAGIVATHSPAFLGDPGARLLHVRRDLSGATEVCVLDGLPHDDDLGLTKADLLALRRVFVIVEGEHDKIVLQSFFRAELQRSFAEILVLRGAPHAVTAAHAEWLLAASDAPFLVVLDKLGETAVLDAWNEARAYALAGRTDDALGAVRKLRNVRKDEAGFLGRLGEAGIRTGAIPRLHFFGLSKDDILMYLPDGPRLVREKKQGLLPNTAVQTIVSSLDRIPQEFTDLMAEVSRLASLFGRLTHARIVSPVKPL